MRSKLSQYIALNVSETEAARRASPCVHALGCADGATVLRAMDLCIELGLLHTKVRAIHYH